jgi:hypothetical protein
MQDAICKITKAKNGWSCGSSVKVHSLDSNSRNEKTKSFHTAKK